MGGAPIVRTTPARAAELLADADPGFAVSCSTMRRLFDDLELRLYRNVKSLSGPSHPDRERQFQYLRPTIDRFLDAGWPVVSIDAKKRELVGAFRNDGRAWGFEPRPVNDHDFPHLADHKATPFGVYDLAANHGYVQVGLSGNTPAFAVAALRAWWVRYGCRRYRGAPELLALADGGGANGHRLWLWKLLLQRELADRYGLAVTVCHYPTGASKWNPVEHRLFGPISQHWAGEPLTSLDRMLGLIRGTGRRGAGTLRVDAALDPRPYPKGLKAPKNPAALLNLQRHEVCPNWNYTLSPKS
jgi:hypothetical protein